MTTLEYIAAKIAMGATNADMIKSTVDSMLVSGVYSKEFLEIMDSKPARIDEVLSPFVAYLEHEGIPVPTKDDAVWQLIAHHVSQIVSGLSDPISALQELISDVYWNYDFSQLTKEYLGDSHGIQYLIGLYWEYDDMSDEDRHTHQGEVRAAIVSRSKEWMAGFANKCMHRIVPLSGHSR